MQAPAVVFLMILPLASRHSDAAGVPVVTAGSWITCPADMFSAGVDPLVWKDNVLPSNTSGVKAVPVLLTPPMINEVLSAPRRIARVAPDIRPIAIESGFTNEK